MKKTYVTSVPDHIGAFLKASRCIAGLAVNITRVSYDKTVDSNTLFLEAEGTAQQLEQVTQQLRKIGYLQSAAQTLTVLLVEFTLPDRPGAVTAVLELIQKFQFNISYISSQEERGTGYQHFKMGLLVENSRRVSDFLRTAANLCPVRVINYDRLERSFDNSIFYLTFANELAGRMDLSETARGELIVQANLVMQLLDEHGGSPHKTFAYIGKFGEALARYKGEAFAPRVTHCPVDDNTVIHLLEPPCGSNTAVIQSGGDCLFVDTGYACYRQEMLAWFRTLLPGFDTCRKAALVTHADVDHCGLLDLFPTVYLSGRSRASLLAERETGGGLREQNPLHAPYVRICKTLTGYQPPDPATLQAITPAAVTVSRPLTPAGSFQFGTLEFEVYEGAGGHLPGEIVLVERRQKVVFTGDIYVNLKEYTREQAAYNQYAPYLMTCVDTDPALAARERAALLECLGPGIWNVFGGHGRNKQLTIAPPDGASGHSA